MTSPPITATRRVDLRRQSAITNDAENSDIAQLPAPSQPRMRETERKEINFLTSLNCYYYRSLVEAKQLPIYFTSLSPSLATSTHNNLIKDISLIGGSVGRIRLFRSRFCFKIYFRAYLNVFVSVLSSLNNRLGKN